MTCATRACTTPVCHDVCIRWSALTSDWSVCYAASYLPVWRSSRNSFATHEAAVAAIAAWNAALPRPDVMLNLVVLPDDQLGKKELASNA